VDEDAPDASWRRGSHGIVAREPAQEKAALRRGAVAVSYRRSPHGRVELAPVLSKQDVTTNCRSGASLSHPLRHNASDCQSHNQIRVRRAKHFSRKASPMAGSLIQLQAKLS